MSCLVARVFMSILDYFSVSSSKSFPNPRGPLSNRIASAAIESANREVRAALNKELLESASSRRKEKKPRVYLPQERAEMGKLAVDIGATEAAKRFSKKLKYPINESTARRFKQLYLQERRAKRLREEEDLTVSDLPMKKRGRPLLLGKNLDEQVQEYILKLREHGCAVNTTVVIAAARGLTRIIEPTRLNECGGPATLSVSWAKSLLKRMNFTKRRVSTKSLVPSQDVEEVRKEFLSELMEAVELHEVPPDLIFNWDQTGILLVPSAQWTMDKKGRKRVPIAGHNDKRQITAVMCGALTGEMLPIQLVYKGTTKRCHPPYNFPGDWLISHSPNHWSNEGTMVEYINEVIVPYVDRKRDDLDLSCDHPAVAIFDHFKGQLTVRVTQVLEENNIHSVLIPAAFTGELQPMDISVNKVVKSFIRNKFLEWYAEQVTELFYNDDDDPVDLSTARMKCVGAQWMVALYEHLTNNPHVIVHGFRHAGIFAALGLLDDSELSEYGEMSADSDYELSDDQQSQGEYNSNFISDSEEDSSHENQLVRTKQCLSVADVFTEDSESD